MSELSQNALGIRLLRSMDYLSYEIALIGIKINKLFTLKIKFVDADQIRITVFGSTYMISFYGPLNGGNAVKIIKNIDEKHPRFSEFKKLLRLKKRFIFLAKKYKSENDIYHYLLTKSPNQYYLFDQRCQQIQARVN